MGNLGGKKFTTNSAFHKLTEVPPKLLSPLLNLFGNSLVQRRSRFFCGVLPIVVTDCTNSYLRILYKEYCSCTYIDCFNRLVS